MNKIVQDLIIVIIALLAAVIVGAYVFYFIGMAVSLAAGGILGLPGTLIAQIFAWAGMGAVLVVFGAASLKTTGTVREVSGDELRDLIENIGEDD